MSKTGRRNFYDLTHQLALLVQEFNRYYVVMGLKALKKAELADNLDKEELEIARDEWTRYLQDFQRFLDEANEVWGEKAFRYYFEPPPKLIV